MYDVDPGMAESSSAEQIIRALDNLTFQLERIADHFDPDGRR